MSFYPVPSSRVVSDVQMPGDGQATVMVAVPVSALSWPVGEGSTGDGRSAMVVAGAGKIKGTGRREMSVAFTLRATRVGAIDGTVTRMSDTKANRAEFQGPGVVPVWGEVPEFGCVRRGVLTEERDSW